MIKVKHLMDEVERDDGKRIWVEPIKLVGDFREWCGVSHDLAQVAPPRELWDWFEEHPDGYDYFRSRYHEWLADSPSKESLQQLARAAMKENITLLHQGSDPNQNTAAALHEFLSELEAYIPRDPEA